MKANLRNDQTGRRADEAFAAAFAAVINGTEWLTAHAVGRQYDPEAIDPLAVTNRWRTETRIFAIELASHTLYPAYLFDETGSPIPDVTEILGVFTGFRPFRIASWFESTSSMLHGRRPREVLAMDSQAVVAAAKDHAAGAVHG